MEKFLELNTVQVRKRTLLHFWNGGFVTGGFIKRRGCIKGVKSEGVKSGQGNGTELNQMQEVYCMEEEVKVKLPVFIV